MSDLQGAISATQQTHPYTMRLSRLTVDKLGVKLYDRASAVVAELIANAYDADAEEVTVTLPLGVALANKGKNGEPDDLGHTIVVADNGHGMTPEEAQRYFLAVGADRRNRDVGGSVSRDKKRPVMGRKGIGKLAPFGICKQIEVRSAGGPETDDGFLTSHFILDFAKIVRDEEGPVPIEAGADDQTWSATKGTAVILRGFLPKRVPNRTIFTRQVARRFALAKDDFSIKVIDTAMPDGTSPDETEFEIPKFQVDVNPLTRVDIAGRPVPFGEGFLPVTGWLAFGKQAIRDEEEAGVRIYARGKIVATTRDFEQPAGFTGEFSMRSYLVGEVHAEWLDADGADDLVRTDRQGILWDSDYGEALRAWGAALIKEIAKASAGPRRESKSANFLRSSRLKERAEERFGSNNAVITAIMDFGSKIGGFAQEDELADDDYVEDLAALVLLVGPHQALIRSFQAISKLENKTVEELVPLFSHTRTAELASYAQIAHERVESIQELREVIDDSEAVEADLQNLVARAPWLIKADWSVITENQGLKAFRDRFAQFWKDLHGEDISITTSEFESKRPDFTLVHLGNKLHIVELKKPKHNFDDTDYIRLQNYLDAFERFFEEHATFTTAFPGGFVVDLVADGETVKDPTRKRAYRAAEREGLVKRQTWYDFLHNATVAHSAFLDVQQVVHAPDAVPALETSSTPEQ